MKEKTLGKVIEIILFKAVIAMAIMFAIVSVNSKTVQATTYQAGKTAYVEEIEAGDIIDKGAIIMSKNKEHGFMFYFYDDAVGFAVNIKEDVDVYKKDQLNNTDMEYSWVVGTSPNKKLGEFPSFWVDDTWSIQATQIDIANETYYISFEEPHEQPQPHDHSYTSYNVVEGNVIFSKCDHDGCDYYDGKAELQLEPQSQDYFNIRLLARFNEQTGLNVSGSDVELYRVETEGATEGGKKVTGIPKKAGYYYASLTVQGVTAKKAFTIENFEWTYNNDYGKKIWYSDEAFKNNITITEDKVYGNCKYCGSERFFYDKVRDSWIKLYTCNHFVTEEPHVDDDGNLDSPKYESLGNAKHKVICDVCGAEYGDALNHDFVVSSDDTSKHICAECGEEENHDFSEQPYKVTEDKAQHYQECKYCEAASTPVDHSEIEVINKKDSTCTEKGYIGDKRCKDCGTVVETGTEVNAKGHTEVVLPAKVATCKETGLTEGKKCSVCGTVTVAQTEIEKLEHLWDEGEVTKAPTCDAPGIKSIHCTLCSVKKDETEIPALEHDWDEGVVTKKPTYTEKGVKTHTCKNDNTHIKTIEIPKLEMTGDVVGEDLDENTEENISTGEIWLTGVRDVTYSGNAVTFDIRAYIGNKLLKEGTDYTIKYANNKNAYRDYSEQNASKIPTVKLIGKGAYKNKVITKTFRIDPIDVNAEAGIASNDVVEVKNGSYKPIPTLTVNGKKLKHKTDYIVVYDSEHGTGFKEVGDYSIKLEGVGNYRGTIVSTFKIVNKNEYSLLSKATVTGYAKKFAYDGTAKEQNKSSLIVKAKVGKTTETLTEGIDYTIAYLNNTGVGTASMIIRAVPGSKKFLGEKIINYAITGTPLSKTRITYDNNKTYTGATVKPAVTLALADGTRLTEGTDYTLEYQKNVNVGTASIILTGKGNYTGFIKKTFKIKPVVLADNESITVTTVGKAVKNAKGKYEIEVAVKNNAKPLLNGVDYTVSFKNNSKPGIATATIKGKGNYTKTITVTFEIVESNVKN